jgi:hypothetical protein
MALRKNFNLLKFQKAVVRVGENDVCPEYKTPVACLCAEVMGSIGANYGEKIKVEDSDMKPIVAECAKLAKTMGFS